MVDSLNGSWIRLVFMLLVAGAFLTSSAPCFAQIVPDTTYNDVTRDTTGRKGPEAGTWQVVTPPAGAGTQKPSIADEADSIPVTPEHTGPFQPNPKKAGLYSAILPGLGQLYNRQYWKIPVVYVAIGVAGYFISNNLNNYRSYRQAYINRINNPNYIDQYTNIYSPSQLQQLQNDYSKYLDLTVLFSGIGYMLQVVDAITSAHLKNFDISRDITMHLKPVVFPTGLGIGVAMNFK